MKLFGDLNVRVWTRALCLLISAATLWFIFSRIDLRALKEVFLNVRLTWFFVALVSFGLCLSLAAWRWHLMLRLSDTVVHGTATLRIVIIAHFFNTLLLGPAGGDLVKSAVYCRWYKFTMPQIIATAFFDRLLGGAGHLLFAAAAFALAAYAGVFQSVADSSLSKEKWAIIFLVCLAAAAAAHMIRRGGRSDSPLVKTIESMVTGLKEMVARPKLTLSGVWLSFLVQVAYSGTLALCLKAVTHEPLPWLKLLWTFPVISLLGGMPITFAGAGVREGTALVLLPMVGVSESAAVASALLTLVAYLIWAAFSGFLYWREDRLFKRYQERGIPSTVSVVIPALNEETMLPRTLASLKQAGDIQEIIVVDGGSSDATQRIAREAGCVVIESKPGRGAQLKAGAERAAGDAILFLHADTVLPSGAIHGLKNCLRDAICVGGGFWKRFDNPAFIMRGSRLRCLFRILCCRRVLADQGIFARRDDLIAVGGIPEMALMEEFEICKRLRRRGRLALAPATVITSARRFHETGPMRLYFRMWRTTLAYYRGKSPEELKRLYESKKS